MKVTYTPSRSVLPTMVALLFIALGQDGCGGHVPGVVETLG